MGYKLNRIYVGTNLVYPKIPNYLCFTANTAGSTIKLNKTGSPTAVTLETSANGLDWSTYTFGDTITLTNIGNKVYRRNTSTTDTGFSTSGANSYRFVMTGSITGSGDINYLLNKNSTTTVSSYCYYRLFYGCTSLKATPQLPATTLADHCYETMFYQCPLTTAPELPATTLASYCYLNLFAGCTGLTTAPSLPATTLASSCYQNMFQGCTGLTSTPVLSATTLADRCYRAMFQNCTSLTTATSLPATTLTTNCYYNMFNGCTNLTTLPSLSATTLTTYCYNSMFSGCSKIKLSTAKTGEYQTAYRIPKTGTGTNGTSSLDDMFASTGGTFTGTPSINTTYYTSNAVV